MRLSRFACSASVGEQARTLKKKLAAVGLPWMNNPSHIVPLFVADPVRCKVMSDRLLNNMAARSSRSTIRPCRAAASGGLTPTPQRSDADMDHLCTLLAEVARTRNVDNAKIGYQRQLTRYHAMPPRSEPSLSSVSRCLIGYLFFSEARRPSPKG